VATSVGSKKLVSVTWPNRGILAKLPLHDNFGELLFYHALQGDSSSDSDVIRHRTCSRCGSESPTKTATRCASAEKYLSC
jgi:hypothetical protein